MRMCSVRVLRSVLERVVCVVASEVVASVSSVSGTGRSIIWKSPAVSSS